MEKYAAFLRQHFGGEQKRILITEGGSNALYQNNEYTNGFFLKLNWSQK